MAVKVKKSWRDGTGMSILRHSITFFIAVALLLQEMFVLQL